MTVSEDRVILYINRSSSRCGECNRGVMPQDIRHETPCGWDSHEGCGAEFTHLSTDYFGMPDGFYQTIKEMRPDLEYIGWDPEKQ